MPGNKPTGCHSGNSNAPPLWLQAVRPFKVCNPQKTGTVFPEIHKTLGFLFYVFKWSNRSCEFNKIRIQIQDAQFVLSL